MYDNTKDDVPSLLGAAGLLLEQSIKAIFNAFLIFLRIAGSLFAALLTSCGFD